MLWHWMAMTMAGTFQLRDIFMILLLGGIVCPYEIPFSMISQAQVVCIIVKVTVRSNI